MYVFLSTKSFELYLFDYFNSIRYERSMSPPRSSNSSGYGTMGSNKSYTTPIDSRFPQNPEVIFLYAIFELNIYIYNSNILCDHNRVL